MKGIAIIAVHGSLREAPAIVDRLDAAFGNYSVFDSLEVVLLCTDLDLEKDVRLLIHRGLDHISVSVRYYPTDYYWATVLQAFCEAELQSWDYVFHINSDLALNKVALEELFSSLATNEARRSQIVVGEVISPRNGKVIYGFKKFRRFRFYESDVNDWSVFNFNFVAMPAPDLLSGLPVGFRFQHAFLDYWVSHKLQTRGILSLRNPIGEDQDLDLEARRKNRSSTYYIGRTNIRDAFFFYRSFGGTAAAILVSIYLMLKRIKGLG